LPDPTNEGKRRLEAVATIKNNVDFVGEIAGFSRKAGGGPRL
jgi:hypothetical protein